MPNVNQVNIMGNVTRDIEIKYTPKGKAVCNFSIAIDHKYTDESGEKRKDTTFVDVELWGRQAEIAHEYAKKGSPLYVTGRLKTDSWDDKDTGKKRTKMLVVGENIQLIGSHSGQRTEGSSKPEAGKAPGSSPRPSTQPEAGDDIPF